MQADVQLLLMVSKPQNTSPTDTGLHAPLEPPYYGLGTCLQLFWILVFSLKPMELCNSMKNRKHIFGKPFYSQASSDNIFSYPVFSALYTHKAARVPRCIP